MEMWMYDDRRYRKGLRMKLGSIVSGVGGVISGIMGAGAAQDAANAQQNAAQNAINNANTTNQAVQQGYQPYTSTGTAALSQINGNLQNGTGFAKQFNMADFYNDPGYQFTLQQGQKAINGSAAAKGGLLSGGTLKSLAGYTSGLANQTYNDAYSRYLQSSQQNYNQLTGLASLGLGAQNQSANANLTTAQNVGNLYTQQGNAQAAGIIGQQNAYNGIFNAVGNAANQYSLNNSMAKSPLSLFGQVL